MRKLMDTLIHFIQSFSLILNSWKRKFNIELRKLKSSFEFSHVHDNNLIFRLLQMASISIPVSALPQSDITVLASLPVKDFWSPFPISYRMTRLGGWTMGTGVQYWANMKNWYAKFQNFLSGYISSTNICTIFAHRTQVFIFFHISIYSLFANVSV